MADDGCTVVGVEEITQLFRDMGEKLTRKALRDALDYSGSVVQEAAIASAPIAEVGTKQHPRGQLKADVRRKIKIDMQQGQGVVAIFPSKHSFYGKFSEFGTSREPARPWLRPAFTASKDAALEVFYKVFQAYIDAFRKTTKK